MRRFGRNGSMGRIVEENIGVTMKVQEVKPEGRRLIGSFMYGLKVYLYFLKPISSFFDIETYDIIDVKEI